MSWGLNLRLPCSPGAVSVSLNRGDEKRLQMRDRVRRVCGASSAHLNHEQKEGAIFVPFDWRPILNTLPR